MAKHSDATPELLLALLPDIVVCEESEKLDLKYRIFYRTNFGSPINCAKSYKPIDLSNTDARLGGRVLIKIRPELNHIARKFEWVEVHKIINRQNAQILLLIRKPHVTSNPYDLDDTSRAKFLVVPKVGDKGPEDDELNPGFTFEEDAEETDTYNNTNPPASPSINNNDMSILSMFGQTARSNDVTNQPALIDMLGCNPVDDNILLLSESTSIKRTPQEAQMYLNETETAQRRSKFSVQDDVPLGLLWLHAPAWRAINHGIFVGGSIDIVEAYMNIDYACRSSSLLITPLNANQWSLVPAKTWQYFEQIYDDDYFPCQRLGQIMTDIVYQYAVNSGKATNEFIAWVRTLLRHQIAQAFTTHADLSQYIDVVNYDTDVNDAYTVVSITNYLKYDIRALNYMFHPGHFWPMRKLLKLCDYYETYQSAVSSRQHQLAYYAKIILHGTSRIPEDEYVTPTPEVISVTYYNSAREIIHELSWTKHSTLKSLQSQSYDDTDVSAAEFTPIALDKISVVNNLVMLGQSEVTVMTDGLHMYVVSPLIPAGYMIDFDISSLATTCSAYNTIKSTVVTACDVLTGEELTVRQE